MKKDWRIDFCWHLKGATLWRSKYTRPHEDWDHHHCTACWSMFAGEDEENVLHEGYTTGPDYKHGARYDWVCFRCFDDLKKELGWTIGDASILSLTELKTNSDEI